MSKEHGTNASHCLITITPIIILTFETILFISNKLNSIYTGIEETTQIWVGATEVFGLTEMQ